MKRLRAEHYLSKANADVRATAREARRVDGKSFLCDSFAFL